MDSSEKCEWLIEAASAVLNAAPNRRLNAVVLNAVVLNKVLFYLDLDALRDRAETMTGNAYIAIQQGPVVAKYSQRLIGQLETRGIGRQINEWDQLLVHEISFDNTDATHGNRFASPRALTC